MYTSHVKGRLQGKNKSKVPEVLEQYGAQVGAGCFAIYLACNGCLETESLRVLPRVSIIYTKVQDERKLAQVKENVGEERGYELKV